MTGPVLGIDIGGTKLAAGLVAPTGEVCELREVATEAVAAGDGELLWERLVRLVDQVLAGGRPRAVGVGCGGPMRWPQGLVSPLHVPAWRDFPLRERLSARYGVPVRLHNDAIAMAVGEHAFGAGRGSSAFLGVVVSTGVGGGLVLGGRVVDGATGNAGHVGHVVVDPQGARCECGGRGCLETVARGRAVVDWARSRGWEPAAGTPADGRSLAHAARVGDPVALAAFARAGRAVGVALASVATLLELDCIAVGGGLGLAGAIVVEPMREAFLDHAAMEYVARCRILPAALDRGAGVVGAATLAMPLGYWSPAGAD